MDNELNNTDMYIYAFMLDLLVFTISVFFSSFLLPIFALAVVVAFVCFSFFSISSSAASRISSCLHFSLVLLALCIGYANFMVHFIVTLCLWQLNEKFMGLSDGVVCFSTLPFILSRSQSNCVSVCVVRFVWVIHTDAIDASVYATERTRDDQRTDWQWSKTSDRQRWWHERNAHVNAIIKCMSSSEDDEKKKLFFNLIYFILLYLFAQKTQRKTN